MQEHTDLLASLAKQNTPQKLGDLLGSGQLVVADLTDPMLSPEEANGVFQVLN